MKPESNDNKTQGAWDQRQEQRKFDCKFILSLPHESSKAKHRVIVLYPVFFNKWSDLLYSLTSFLVTPGDIFLSIKNCISKGELYALRLYELLPVRSRESGNCFGNIYHRHWAKDTLAPEVRSLNTKSEHNCNNG